MKRERTCELLAPAGGKKQFIAAVENGADAIYLGGPFYNARIGAENFSLEDMEGAMDYGHLMGVKTYITMNTLMGEKEQEKALEYAYKLYGMGADGLIVQDLGLGKLIREQIPNFPLHLSTQATVYNPEGVRAAKKLGYERVVLARELTLEEIRKCCKEGIEIETFIHGALCMCYSGQCQLSRFIGGRSGNKGVCAQPCRLPYENHQGKDTKYPLSPKDLSMIDRIGDLIDAGVNSLKIEGRMKSPEYVATVVGIYRKYLDQHLKEGKYQVAEEDREELTQIFNRGGFTTAYLEGNPKEEILSGQVSKNEGIEVGRITTIRKYGKICHVELTGPLEQGDVVEVRGKDGRRTSTKVTYYKKMPDGKLAIGDFKEPVRKGEEVYRLISDRLVKKAKKSFADVDFEQGKFSKKSPVNMVMEAFSGEELKLTVYDDSLKTMKILKGEVVQEAEPGRTNFERIKNQLRKTGSTPFYLENVEILSHGDIFLPTSKINEIRRLALDEFLEKKILTFKREKERGRKKIERAKGLAGGKGFQLWFSNLEDFRNGLKDSVVKGVFSAGATLDDVVVLLPAYDLIEKGIPKTNLRITPYIENLTKGFLDSWLRENRNQVVKLGMSLGGEIYVGNIGHIEMFRETPLTLLGDFGLNICNDRSADAYGELGIQGFVSSLEMLDQPLGNYPLMVTEYLMKQDTLVDRKGATYKVERDPIKNKTLIRSGVDYIQWEKIGEIWKKQAFVRVYL